VGDEESRREEGEASMNEQASVCVCVRACVCVCVFVCEQINSYISTSCHHSITCIGDAVTGRDYI
jgi:hypothetical protein